MSNFRGSRDGKRGRGRGQWRRDQRDHFQDDYRKGDETNRESVDETCPVIQAFRKYQVEIDKKHDKYERLVKVSRDVTVESKRIIFHLHRIIGDQNKEAILKEAQERFQILQSTLLQEIALELINEDFYHYIRAYSPGLQEYIEAISFYYYLKDGILIDSKDIQKELDFTKVVESMEEDNDNENSTINFSLVIPPIDYILGIADLTGELMRKCINSVGHGDLDEPFRLCNFLQNIYNSFSSVRCVNSKLLTNKIQVLKTSLGKVENACCTIKVRGSEIPKHMLADVFSTGNFNADSMDFET